jgi:SAM-dependent methyltransferase
MNNFIIFVPNLIINLCLRKDKNTYQVEPYWSQVAQRIRERGDKNLIAGDDEPFYRYKRKEFLRLLHEVVWKGISVLEIGCGPGGNLIEIAKHQPDRLAGADISAEMIALAKNNTPTGIEFFHTNGTTLPFENKEFDVCFSATVLQHNTDEKMLTQLINEMSRVSVTDIYIFERIEKVIKGDELCYGRPVEYYKKLFAVNGFEVISSSFINIQVSYLVCGAIRKLFNPSSRKEGEPLTSFSIFLQKITLPVTSILDKIFKSERDLCRIHLKRKELVDG